MPNRHDDVVRGFAEACQRGDLAALRATLDADAVAVCDSGGLVRAPLEPVHGADDVTQLIAALLSNTEPTVESVNGRTGLALRRAGRAVAVLAVEVTDARIAVLWIVLNPAKLTAWQPRPTPGQRAPSGRST